MKSLSINASVALVAIVTFVLPTKASACWFACSPVAEAIDDDRFDITLAEYRLGKRDERLEYIQAYMTVIGAPQDDTAFYESCMGDFTVTKNQELLFDHVFAWCSNEAANNRDIFESHFNELDAENHTATAQVMCQNSVKSRLTSPSTADFPWLADVYYLGEWRYRVVSYVDSQNGFGSTIRTNYTCAAELSRSPDAVPLHDSSWTIELDLR